MREATVFYLLLLDFELLINLLILVVLEALSYIYILFNYLFLALPDISCITS